MTMKEMLIKQAVTMLLTMLSPNVLRTAIDAILDIVEDAVTKSETTVDDTVVLPVIEMLRATFNIPDNDDA